MISIQKTTDFVKIRDIRAEIFKRMGLSEEDIFDEDDKILEQFIIKHGSDIVGSFRLRSINNFHKIERMGILPQYQSKGIGRLALDEIKAYSKNTGKSKIILDSIYNVRDFYAKSGFVQVGEVFFKVGIPHVSMYCEI